LHLLYRTQTNSFFVTEWTIGDMLTYGGALMQAVATIVAIKLTIDFTISNQREERRINQDNQKEERRLAIKPYLTTEYRSVYALIESVDNYSYITIKKADQPIGSSDIHCSYNVIREKSNNSVHNVLCNQDFMSKHHIIEYTIANYGAGNALDVEFSLNIINDESLVIPPFVLPKDSSRSFIFLFSGDMVSIDDGEVLIELRLLYSDIEYISRYKQEETIRLYRDSEAILSTTQEIGWVLSKPEVIAS